MCSVVSKDNCIIWCSVLVVKILLKYLLMVRKAHDISVISAHLAAQKFEMKYVAETFPETVCNLRTTLYDPHNYSYVPKCV